MRTSLCIFGTGKARPWYGETPSFNWKETGLVFQSPNVPSKSDSNLARRCSNFWWWSALRCLQLFFIIDWRSAFAYLASSIRVARLVASNVLNSSSWLSYCLAWASGAYWSLAAGWWWSLARWFHQRLLSWFKVQYLTLSWFIPKNEAMFAAYCPFSPNYIRFWIVPFAVRVIEVVQLYPSFTVSLGDPSQSIPRLWNQPFWVEKQHGCVFVLQRLGLRQNYCLTGPALFAFCSACYCGGGGNHALNYPSSQLLLLWFTLWWVSLN